MVFVCVCDENPEEASWREKEKQLATLAVPGLARANCASTMASQAEIARPCCSYFCLKMGTAESPFAGCCEQ